MKRDMDLIRQILLKVESSDKTLYSFGVCGYQQREVDYNLELLISRRLVNGQLNRPITGGINPAVHGLTWDGHDLLDSIRSESMWEKTKDYLKARDLQNVPFEVLTKVLVSIISKQAGVD